MRPKVCKFSFNEPLCRLIALRLRLKWFPQQIAGLPARPPCNSALEAQDAERAEAA